MNSLRANIAFGMNKVKKPSEKSTAFFNSKKIIVSVKKNTKDKICKKK